MGFFFESKFTVEIRTPFLVQCWRFRRETAQRAGVKVHLTGGGNPRQFHLMKGSQKTTVVSCIFDSAVPSQIKLLRRGDGAERGPQRRGEAADQRSAPGQRLFDYGNVVFRKVPVGCNHWQVMQFCSSNDKAIRRIPVMQGKFAGKCRSLFC